MWTQARHTFEGRLGLGMPTSYQIFILGWTLSSGSENAKFVCEAQPYFPFLSLLIVFLNTLTKGPVDQSDKAILVPFLECTENSFKAMQKRELLFTLPLFCCRIMELKENVIPNSTNVFLGCEYFPSPKCENM